MSSPSNAVDQADLLATDEQYRNITGEPIGNPLRLLSASGVVRSYCRWPISAFEGATLTVDSDGTGLLMLPCTMVRDVEAIAVDGEPVTGWVWSQAGMVRLCGGRRWPVGYRRVTVTYSGGYTTIPAEIVAVVVSAAGRMTVPAAVAQRTVGNRSITYARATDGAGLVDVEKQILGAHRISLAP